MKFTVLLTLLPVVLAVPNPPKSCILENPSCNELSEKCAADVKSDSTGLFRPAIFASCVATVACMGSPYEFRANSCVGREHPFNPKSSLGDITPEIQAQVTNCSGDDCSVTAQNFIDLIYSQLSTNWPESPEFVLNTWWSHLVHWVLPNIEDPAHATIPWKKFNKFFANSVTWSVTNPND